jgi:hypothetical protein
MLTVATLDRGCSMLDTGLLQLRLLETIFASRLKWCIVDIEALAKSEAFKGLF